MRLTDHFTLEELQSASSTPTNPQQAQQMATLLEAFRVAGGSFPLRVTSFGRSPERNVAVGGVETSQHLVAQAADVVPIGVDLNRWALNVMVAERTGTLPEYSQFIIYPGAGDHAHIGLPTITKRGEKLVKTSPESGMPAQYGQLSIASIAGPKVLTVLAVLGIVGAIARAR